MTFWLLSIIANDAAQLIDTDENFTEKDFIVNQNYLGEGYAIVSNLERNAIKLTAQKEGLLLDPVYTGRAFGGMIDLIKKGFFKPTDNILFWHTGGTPALFAYVEQL